MKENNLVLNFVRVGVLLIIMAISIIFISPIASKPETYNGTIAKLNEKQTLVMEVTGAATVSSIGIAAIPDDATTPVANKIMDLAGYLVLVLCAIVLEKYLLTIIGYTAFHWMIPAACVLFGINTFARNRTISRVAIKILTLSIVLLLVVPVSVRVSDLIEKTYGVSIEGTGESAEEENILAETEGFAAETEAETESANEERSSGGWFSDLTNALGEVLDNAKETTAEIAEAAASTVTSLTDDVISKAQDALNDLVETVVVLIVTNCLLPIIVLAFMLWVLKLILGIQIDLPDPGKMPRPMHRNRKYED